MLKISRRVLPICFCLLTLVSTLVSCSRGANSARTRVEIWHNWNVEEGGTEHELKVLVDEYNSSQSTVEVVLVSQPSEGFADKVYTSVANGTGPDIYFNFATAVPDYAAEGLLADMGKYINTETLKQRISESLWRECTGTDGKLHIIPIQTSVPVLFYNKTLYDECGLKSPQTWEDIEENAKLVFEEKGIPGFAADSYIDLAQMLFCQTGAEYINTVQKSVGFNTPQCADQLKWFASCVSEGYFTANFESGSIDQDFNAGLLASFLGTCTYEPYIIPDGFEYAVAPAPTMADIKWAPLFSRGAIVFASDQQTEAAACNFLEFFTNAQNSARWSMAIGSLSPYNDVEQSVDYEEYIISDPVLQAAEDTLDYAYTTPAVIGAPIVRKELNQMFLQVIGGIKSVEVALSDAEKNCNRALQS